GKSSIAVNVAAAIAARGYKVGLMDVDIHGPSIPQMLGIPVIQEQQNTSTDSMSANTISYANGKIIPAGVTGSLSVVSIECMLESNATAVIWRGPLKIGVIRQFLSDVAWGELDYLIIDSPPGTGDEPLTVAQTIPDAHAIIVTTPQEVSLRDVRKSINFCRQVNLDITGLIENFSGFICPSCKTRIDLFKTGGGKSTAEQMNITLLGTLPVFPEMVAACDQGVAAVDKSDIVKQAFDPVVEKIIAGASVVSGK
ncbi:MAG: P-loop NTPase, partial [Chitinivibrionales bacterium]|nr:P-loop NTPase [Chitinivibrionales bacterium]